MIRERLMDKRPLVEGGFHLRGENVSRLEALSDAVFGLAITLVVVSTSSDGKYSTVLRQMENVPAIAACFATLYSIWARHYLFCRRFGLEDLTIRVLNGALLFVVALYAYPLRFVFQLVFSNFLHLGAPTEFEISVQQVRGLMTMYGAGWVAAHLVFAGMYWHALRVRSSLGLTPREVALTKLETWQGIGYAGVGAVSIILALCLPDSTCGFSGFAYTLTALVGTLHGHLAGEARRKYPDEPLLLGEKLQPVAERVPTLEPVDAGDRD